MKPPCPLQTPLLRLVCFSLLLLSLSSLALKVDAANPPIIARPGCQAACGNVSIPFPFGIGTGCLLESWYEIICNASNNNNKKPLLARFPNIQVLNITIPDYGNRWFRSVTVGLPSLNGCGAKYTKRFGIDLRGSPFNFSTDYNLFLMEGCAGSTLLIDQSNNKVLGGCTTTCHNKNHSTVVSTNKCDGDVDECCQLPLTSQPSYPYHYYNSYQYYHYYNSYQSSALQFYEIGFYGQSSG